MRWQEFHYFVRGKNPYDVLFANDLQAHAAQPSTQASVVRDSRLDLDLGLSKGVTVPPGPIRRKPLFFGCLTNEEKKSTTPGL